MRFVLTLGAFALLSSSAIAAPWDIVSLKDNKSRSVTPVRAIQMQRGGSSSKLQTIEGLDLTIAASNLGKTSSLALGRNGTVFVADSQSGRIWTLTDRGEDGKIDLRRPLPFTFENPTGLASLNDTLYVADNNAVWVIEKEQHPKELANLRQVNAAGGPHKLSLSPDGSSLLLGLTLGTQGFRVLELDKLTGQASLIGEEDDGPLHSLAQLSGSHTWAASSGKLAPIGASGLELSLGQSITAIALPGQFETPQDWPAQLNEHIIASHIGRNAMQLIAIPTEFGQLSEPPHVLVEGFLTRSGRSAWGRPGPIVMDKRGLFFADSYNGTLWRLSPTPKPQPKITIVDTASLPIKPSAEPNLTSKGGALKIGSSIQGTQIDASSTIIKPSSIEYGSKLIKDYDEKKALEDADKAPKKKRRMSRNRKQKNN